MIQRPSTRECTTRVRNAFVLLGTIEDTMTNRIHAVKSVCYREAHSLRITVEEMSA